MSEDKEFTQEQYDNLLESFNVNFGMKSKKSFTQKLDSILKGDKE